MYNTIRQILEETKRVDVEDIYYDGEEEQWILTYKNGMTPEYFIEFGEVYNFLTDIEVD